MELTIKDPGFVGNDSYINRFGDNNEISGAKSQVNS